MLLSSNFIPGNNGIYSYWNFPALSALVQHHQDANRLNNNAVEIKPSEAISWAFNQMLVAIPSTTPLLYLVQYSNHSKPALDCLCTLWKSVLCLLHSQVVLRHDGSNFRCLKYIYKIFLKRIWWSNGDAAWNLYFLLFLLPSLMRI